MPGQSPRFPSMSPRTSRIRALFATALLLVFSHLPVASSIGAQSPAQPKPEARSKAGAQVKPEEPVKPELLWEAARAGDLARVKRVLDQGIPVDTADRYAATALFKAAAAGHLEVVEFLLSKGADPSVRESFWGQRAVDGALGDDHLEVAGALLAAGAEGREDVFAMAMGTASGAADPKRNQTLARTAIASGPFFESSLEQLRSRRPPAPFDQLLARATSRPDPPPPVLGADQLETYSGNFEGWSDERTVVARVADGKLVVEVDGKEPIVLEPVAEKSFRSVDGSLNVDYFGRFGSIEGIFLGGRMQGALRRSVAEPVANATTAHATDETTRAKPPGARRKTTNWPGFRGDNGDGIGDGLSTPESWNLATGDNVRWSAEIEGLGNSSPVIWGDRVYLTTAVATGIEQEVVTGDTGSGADVEEAVEHSWQVLAFDKASGRQLWNTEVGKGVPATRRHFKGSQANSTPATNGDRLVVVFPTAGLACLDRDGKILWHHDLGPLNASNFFDPDDQWGFASSPIIYRDTVILQVDVFGGGYLAAWSLADGRLRWKTERDVATSWSTPTVLEGNPATGTGDELIVNASSIRGYDPTDGRQLWSLGPNSELVIARPVASEGVAYVSAGYAPVKPVYAIRAGLRGDLEVKPGEEHGALVWSQPVGGAYMPSPLLYDGLFYVVHHNGRIVAYDPATGDAFYKARFSKGGTFTGSPIANNGRLYIPTEDGLLYVVAAGPEYKEIAVLDFEQPLMATPSISDGILFVRTPSHLYALGQ